MCAKKLAVCLKYHHKITDQTQHLNQAFIKKIAIFSVTFGVF